MKFNRLLVVAGALVLTFSSGQAQDWKFGLGASYRQFDDVDFESPGNRVFDPIRLLVHDGQAVVFSPANLASLVGQLPPDGMNFVSIVENVQISAGYNGGDEEIGSSDRWAPVLTAEYLFMTKERLSLSAVFNFQYFNVEVDQKRDLGVSNVATQHKYGIHKGQLMPEPLGSGVAYGQIDTAGFVRNQFEMDLFAIDLGLKLAYSFDFSVDLFVAVGPSVNIVDLDSKVTERASYSAPGLAAPDYYRPRPSSDSDTDVLFGLYGAIGAQYWFNERVGISLEARYDEVFDKASTDLAELDLSGFSGLGKIMIRF